MGMAKKWLRMGMAKNVQGMRRSIMLNQNPTDKDFVGRGVRWLSLLLTIIIWTMLKGTYPREKKVGFSKPTLKNTTANVE
jgi:hypothetical protein